MSQEESGIAEPGTVMNQPIILAQSQPEPIESIGSNSSSFNFYEKAYAALNGGAFAVLIAGLFAYLAIIRSVRSATQSQIGQSLIATINQIRENQEHVETLVEVAKSQTTVSLESSQLIEALKILIEKDYEKGSERHMELLNAINSLKQLIDK